MFANSSGSSKGNDLRREPRHATRKKLKINRVGAPQDSAPHLIELIDCSSQGMGFLSDLPLAAGDEFMISIKLRTMSQLIYAVRHCRPDDHARYILGAEFIGFASSAADADRELILKSLLMPE